MICFYLFVVYLPTMLENQTMQGVQSLQDSNNKLKRMWKQAVVAPTDN
jgi:hypothetical protein